MTSEWIYIPERVHLSLAGSGNPWGALTSFRKRILRTLHDYPDIDDLARILDNTKEELKREIEPLLAASLVLERDDSYRPAFLVADENETLRVV